MDRNRARSALGLVVLSLALMAVWTGGASADYPQIRLNTDTTLQLQNEQQICVNPTNPANLVAAWRDFRLGYRQVGVGYSLDGGATWTDYLIGGEYPLDSDPVLTVHRDGTFYLVVINYIAQGNINQLSVHRSNDGGVSWDGPFTAVFSSGSTFEDKEWIAVDRTGGARDGWVYISWSRFNDVKIMNVTSSDRGQTWTAPVQVSDSGAICQFAVPIVLRNGNLLVAWDAYYTNRISYDISTNGGASWGTDLTLTSVSTSPQSDINGGITVFPYPSLAMDETNGPRAGVVYCLYPDRAVSANGMDIWIRRSTDNGLTWSNRVRVNDDPTGLNRDQFHPWVFCDESGVLHASWYDRRDDPSNYLWHIYYSKSTDGGSTWATNVRVTDVPSSPGDALLNGEIRGGGRDGIFRAGLIGEYSGITAVGGTAYPIWTDTRNGHQDTYASIIGPPADAGNPADRVTRLTLRAVPNPSPGMTELRLSLPIAEGSSLEIVDTSGRRVRSLPTESLPVGATRLEWDGRDDGGRPLAAGVYFTRLTDDAHPEGIRTKVILAR